MRRVGLVHNPDNSIDMLALKQFETNRGKLGLKSIRAPMGKKEDIAAAFDWLKRDKAQG